MHIQEEKMVLSIGQFIQRKGFDILLKAAENLDRSIGVYIIGGIPDESYIQMAKNAGIERIHFGDFMDKFALEDYFRAADVFVLPTREDVWGLVINEAMAHAVPVITTDRCIAGLELVGDMEGAIVCINDDKGIQEAITTIFEDESKKDKKGLECQLIMQQYTYEQMAFCHFCVFENCFHSSGNDK